VVAGREEAFSRYDEAMARGHTAALLDQERGDIYFRLPNAFPLRISYA
jgi:hypothetical protein